MNALKLITTAALFAAASSAFAGTDDGVIDNFPAQTRVSVQAPAPVAAASVAKQTSAKDAAQSGFVHQLNEGSDGGQE